VVGQALLLLLCTHLTLRRRRRRRRVRRCLADTLQRPGFHARLCHLRETVMKDE
jgi:hypothetical protein